MSIDRDVLIVGAGPVGCTLALELGRRGIRCLIVDQRAERDPALPKCNTVSARSMEILRRHGLADEVRCRGLPADHPCDVIYSTRFVSGEMARMRIPSRSERYTHDAQAFDGNWPTPEPPHRINQLYLEPLLREAIRHHPLIEMRYETRLVAVETLKNGAQATLASASGKTEIAARFLAACDGGRSTVRQMLNVSMLGEGDIGSVKAAFLRSASLAEARRNAPGWMTWVMNHERRGNVVAINGRDLWLVHCSLNRGETFDSVELPRAIQQVLGCAVDYELLGCENWTARRLVASTYRVGNIFLAGDAAHLWVPYAGFGMNAGIEDAVQLGWSIAAVLKGWGGEGLLGAYEIERRQAGELVSHAVVRMMREQHSVPLPVDIDGDSPDAQRERERVGAALLRRDAAQFNPIGMNFGIQYAGSPTIAYDAAAAPAFAIDSYQPSTTPGCRAPNVELNDARWLHDLLGDDFTLVVGRGRVDTSAAESAARNRGVPLALLDVSGDRAATAVYDRPLVLVRPDQRIAWRGEAFPQDGTGLLDRIRGTRGEMQATFWVNEHAL